VFTEKQSRGNTEFIESTLQPLIDTLRRPSLDSSIVVDTCNEIYEVLDSCELLILVLLLVLVVVLVVVLVIVVVLVLLLVLVLTSTSSSTSTTTSTSTN